MAAALKDRSESGGPSVAFACGVWSDLARPLKPAFRQAVVGTYKAEASVVDFLHAPEEARGQINTWAAQKTKNLINSVLPPGSIDPATTRVVVGNAVYFKGAWEGMPFDRRHTVHKPFHRLEGSHIDVCFMQSRMRQFVAVHDGFKVLKLPYRMAAQGHPNKVTPTPAPFGRVELERRTVRYAAPPQRAADQTQFSMCIFLPEAHDGLRGLLDTIASRPGFLHDHLPHRRVDVREIRVPKFKLSFYSSIVDVLTKLGLRLPFYGKADLSDMVEDDSSGLPIVVDNVIHKAVIEVNEEGTKATAVTMVISAEECEIQRWSPPPQVPTTRLRFT
jgi:serpin B